MTTNRIFQTETHTQYTVNFYTNENGNTVIKTKGSTTITQVIQCGSSIPHSLSQSYPFQATHIQNLTPPPSQNLNRDGIPVRRTGQSMPPSMQWLPNDLPPGY